MIVTFAFLTMLSECDAMNLAIARTFSLSDAKQLPGSFDVWGEHRPCTGIGKPSVDLFLAFSQSLENDEATAAIVKVKQAFEETNGWGGCIANLFAFGTHITPEEDLYNSKEQAVNPYWVNGPNRQFERTVRKIQTYPERRYDLMYLMEMDSVPVKDFWLDILLEEIKVQTDEFAVLGSKYRGDKWDSFFSQMPSALINHLNGNALYNLTHPMFNSVLARLEVEASTSANSIPYDYRMSQIVEEIQTGIKPSISRYTGVVPASRLPDQFVEFGRTFRLNSIFRETRVIGNYASTNMVKEYLDEEEAIVHGAILRSSWDEQSLGAVTLVVSDWEEAHSTTLLSRVEHSVHPFGKILVILPENTKHPEQAGQSTPIEFFHRDAAFDAYDLCTAPVNSTWFMMTDSYHKLRQNLQLMTEDNQDGSHKPVVSFSKANSETCFAFSQCASEWQLAEKILPSVRNLYQNQEFIFHTETRNEYCQAFEADFTSATPPSATSYVAYLQATGRSQALYAHSDKSNTGTRQVFLPLPTSMLPPVMKLQRRLQGNDTETETSTDDCMSHDTLAICSEAGCEWHENFGFCRDFAPTVTNINRDLPPRKTRPVWATVFLALGVAAAGLALIALSIVGFRRSRSEDDTDSSFAVAPVPEEDGYQLDASSSPSSAANVGNEEENSFNSFETISLIDFNPVPAGNFQENEEGIEFVGEEEA